MFLEACARIRRGAYQHVHFWLHVLTDVTELGFSTLADRIGAILELRGDVRLEQAVSGIDLRDEKAIQSLLADGLAKD